MYKNLNAFERCLKKRLDLEGDLRRMGIKFYGTGIHFDAATGKLSLTIIHTTGDTFALDWLIRYQGHDVITMNIPVNIPTPLLEEKTA